MLVIIIIILIIFLLSQKEYCRQSFHHKFLEGFWKAPKKFCDEAKLDYAYVNFGKDKVYYLAEVDGKLIMNYCVGYKISNSYIKNINEESIEFKIIHDDEISPLPKELKAKLLLSEGMLVLYDDDNETVHLQLFKQFGV